MKKILSFCVFAPAALALAVLHAASYEEIDLAGGDDSAVERANGPKVERTDDGYIDVVCDDATIASVLQQFRRCTRMNILSGESTNLNRRVSATLTHVPWCTALQSILGLANFKMDDRGGIWFVSEKTPEEVRNATRYYVLKHASAADLADLFNGVTMKTSYEERNSIRGKQSINAQNQSKSAAGELNVVEDTRSAIAGRARATAFPNTNTLVLNGPEANLIECERIIRELDRAVTQVYIEARFIELSSEALHKLGIQWDQLQSWGATVRGLKAGYESNDGNAANYGEYLTQRSINNNSTTTKTITDNDSRSSSMSSGGENSANASASSNNSDNDTTTLSENINSVGLVPSEIAEAAGAGASAASMGWRNASTFAGQLSADDFRLALSAFEQLQEGKLFSNPRIIVANGKEARVDMTTKEPYIQVTADRSGTESQNLSVATKLETIPGTDRNLFAGEAFFSYGITLSVKPRVSPAGLISVEVVPSISELKRYIGANRNDRGEIINDTPSTAYPIISVKSINTEFTMKDGATAVIGGLSQTSEQDVDSGIPYLRKLPWIGPKLFGWQSRQKVQNEILVCVTVGIANPETLQKDAGLPTNAVLGREYVEGRRLEPGLRPDAVRNITEIDTRTLDQIRRDPYRTNDISRVDDEEIDLENEPPEVLPEPVAAPIEESKADEPPVTKVEPAPAIVTEIAPAPVVEVKPEPVAEIKPEPAPAVEVKPAPVVEVKPEPVVEVKPAPVVEVKAEPTPAPSAETRKVVKRIIVSPSGEERAAEVQKPAETPKTAGAPKAPAEENAFAEEPAAAAPIAVEVVAPEAAPTAEEEGAAKRRRRRR